MNDREWESWVKQAIKGDRLHEPSPEAMRRAMELGARLPRPWYGSLWNLGLAAAAMLVFAVGVGILMQPGGPNLPPRTEDPDVRGGEVELISPAGELSVAPRLLAWVAIDGAVGYRVRILEVDDAPLWEAVVAGESVNLPEEVRERIRQAVLYRWQVVAVDGEQRVLATSELSQFRVAP